MSRIYLITCQTDNVIVLYPQGIVSQFRRVRKGERAVTLPDARNSAQEEMDLDDLLDAAELPVEHDADEDDSEEPEDARNKAEDAMIEELEEDHPELVLTDNDIRQGQQALEKVCKAPLGPG